MMPRRSNIVGAAIGLGWSLLAAPGWGQTAPNALYNKTVVLTWTEHRVQKADSGEVRESTTESRFAIYVSSAGRLFSEFTRRNPRSGRSNASLQGPEGETT